MIKVKVVKLDGAAAVVEFGGKRVIVPREALDRSQRCERETFECGIPYGVDFETLFSGIAVTTGVDIARELHNLGIWTVEDVMADSVRVRQAINLAHGTTLTTVLNSVRALKK